MRGAANLIEMRKRRKAPAMIFLDADKERLPFPDWELHNVAGERTNIMHLQPEPGESLGRLDLRCLVGMVVVISGKDAARVHAVRDAAIAAKAKRVIATVQQQVGHDEWVAFKTIEYTDTAEKRWLNC
ncbi:MAG: hypothetical protein ABMA00_13670 [Gemmatimonas sp.]